VKNKGQRKTFSKAHIKLLENNKTENEVPISKFQTFSKAHIA
jgi:hypothetical protein